MCHATFASKYPVGDSRKKASQQLLKRVQACQQQLCVWTQQGGENSASFAGSLAKISLPKHSSSIWLMNFLMTLWIMIRSSKRIKDVHLSARTIRHRAIRMAKQVRDLNAATYFFLALDESTDVNRRMLLVIQMVNFNVARALNDCQFKTLLDEVGSNYPGLLLHSNVHFISRRWCLES